MSGRRVSRKESEPVPRRNYISLNIVNVLIWAVLGAVIGYLLGNMMEILLGDIGRYGILVLGALAGLAVLVGVAFLGHRRRGRSA